MTQWFRARIRMLALLSMTGCAALGGRPPEVREIAVEMPVARGEAIRRTAAVFREQGYRIRETPTSGTEPETEPFRHGDADAVFRAVVSGSATTSRVVFSGTYRPRQLAGLTHGSERPVHHVDADDLPLDRELWARLDNLAIMLRRRGR
jgi:hypothetical protein